MDKSRARWLCRRGMKELDVLLEKFLERHYDGLSAQRKQAFHDLLRMEDPDLHACLMGFQSAGTPEINDVIAFIRDNAG
jgi:antitoxin CptB